MKLSSLPRSLSQVRESVRRSGTDAAIYVRGRRASAWQQVQGTRAAPTQGTASAGNTPNPLRAGESITPDRPSGWDDQIAMTPYAVFSTEAPVVEGAPGTLIQTRDWPPNPSRESLSPSSGHREQIRTDATIQMGEGPGRIPRGVPIRVFGVVSAAQGQRGTEASYTGNMAAHDYLPHIPIARKALGIKGPQKLSDDNAVIPAIYAGNPRG